MKKMLFDGFFILIAAAFLIIAQETGLTEKYSGFALIPVLIAYYIGQFVAKKFSVSEKE